MISREKLIKSLGNSKFKSIQLPNNGNYLQKSYLDNKKLEFDSILKKLNLLKENSNILNVIPQIKNQLESHYHESIIQENKPDIQSVYFQERSKRAKIVRRRSNINFFAFHFSSSIMQVIRNFFMKFLVKRKNFISSYLGSVYKH